MEDTSGSVEKMACFNSTGRANTGDPICIPKQAELYKNSHMLIVFLMCSEMLGEGWMEESVVIEDPRKGLARSLPWNIRAVLTRSFEPAFALQWPPRRRGLPIW